ncbi:branched-chain amino acid ABC transporter permease [Sneathiella sp. CAU 1612]|jgi:branched-chain amino acid transport system permease protein|uniref:Branched-chain amino acid ABC transporter permease n=1 Tax=Sneathiella sedimenti TaxID=2816034 RepID=A0ABS3F3R8_9PROT|nr:branched-chain amino acid ABC transporter permease [Sneathiella sedimenti]MBO0333151.1 branched-chain amino acid ABC transporter permease [Sneathiella sedimenti]
MNAQRLMALIVAIVISVPLMFPEGHSIGMVNAILIWSIFAIGFDLVFGVAGMLSFGHAAFFGVGAYTLSLLTMRMGWDFLPALGAAGVIGGALALVFSYFAIRVSGLFFALLTLALSQLIYIMAGTKLRMLTGGVDGIAGVPRPDLFGIDFYDDGNYYFFLLALFVLALLISGLIRISPLGQALKAIKSNEVRAEQIGFNVQRLQRSVFTISGIYAGVSGGLLASLIFYVGPQMLHWSTSGDVVIMVLLGGMGTLFGPILGVAIFEIMREWLSTQTSHWYGILGLIFIISTIGMPKGIAGLIQQLWNRIMPGGKS